MTDMGVQAHSAKSKQDMTAREYFSSPQPVEELVIKPNKSVIGKAFKAKAKEVQAALENLSSCEEDALRLKVSAICKCTAVTLNQTLPAEVIASSWQTESFKLEERSKLHCV